MATRLVVDDIKDELIRPIVTDAILQECDDYLNDLAMSKGYMLTYLSKAEYTIDDIPTPLAYKVKRLAVAWVCREVCSRKAGSASGKAFRGQDTTDIYAGKLNYFQRQVDALESQITPEVMLGIITSSTVGQVTLERG